MIVIFYVTIKCVTNWLSRQAIWTTPPGSSNLNSLSLLSFHFCRGSILLEFFFYVLINKLHSNLERLKRSA